MNKTGPKYEAVGDADCPAEKMALSEEQLRVEKRRVPTGRVRVHTKMDIVNEHVVQELKAERFDITKVPVNSYVEAPPPIRVEGDVTIIPVLEEVLVIETKLLLKEEIHVRRTVTTETVAATIPVRKQRAVVESDLEE